MRPNLQLGRRLTNANRDQAMRDEWLLQWFRPCLAGHVAFSCFQVEDVLMFDATARNGIASRTEKQDTPACLPMVSFTGNEGANMKYETPSGIVFTFIHKDWRELPLVMIENVPGLPGIHTYFASMFLDVAATNGKFTIGPSFDSQEPFVLEPHEVMCVAYMVRNQSDPSKGHFEMKWVASDPFLPF